MIRSGHRKVFVSGKVSEAFRPTDGTGTGVILPSYPRSASNPYQVAVLADSPLLYWTLNESSGTNVADLGSGGFTGTTHGTVTRNVAAAATNLGVAATLGGTIADYIDTPNAAALQITGAVTYEAWVKLAVRNAVNVVMSKGYVGANTGGYQLYIDGSGNLKLNNPYSGSTVILQGGGTTISTGSWFHVVATRDGSNNTALYVNGTSVQTGTSATTINTSTAPMTIGANNANGTLENPLNGSIDEVAVYNTALSSGRVSAHYAART